MPPLIFSMNELPEPLFKLHGLWDGWRGDRELPARRDFQVEALVQWLARVALIEVLAESDSFLFKVYGSELALWSGRELTGRIFPAKDLGAYARIVRLRAPACIQDDVLMNGHSFKIRTLMLPLSDDGKQINLLMSCSHRLP